MSMPLDPSAFAALCPPGAGAPPSIVVTRSAASAGAGRHLASPFGRGWVPVSRDLGLPGEGTCVSVACPSSPFNSSPCPSTIADCVRDGPPPPVGEDLDAQPLCASAPLREPLSRLDQFTPERRARFLTVLAEAGSVRAACARVGVSAECVYRLRRRDPAFAAGWDGALVLARRAAEDILAQRALEGVEEPIFYRGERVGSRLRFDGRLLLAHLARLDAHAAASAHGAERAARFDELVALVAGEAPPRGLEPGQPAPVCGARREIRDEQLPPRREDWIETIDASLSPDSISEDRHDYALAAAAARWDRWHAAATARVDRLAGSAISPWTLSTVSTPRPSAGLGMGMG